MKRLTYGFKVFLLLLAALLAVSGTAQAGSGPNFNVIAGISIPPVVTSISPSTALNTAPVTAIMAGGYFYTGANTAGVTALRLTKTSGTPATINISAYSVISETQIVNAIIPQGYPVGSYDVRATTIYGENSTSAMQFVFTTTVAAPVISAVTSPTNATTQLLSGTKTTIAEVIKINGSTTGVSILSPTTWLAAVNLNEGVNNFSVTALDAVGDESTAATTAILLDTIPPAVPVIAAVTSPTNITTQMLTGIKASDATVIKVNGGTTGVSILSSTTWQASVNLNEGNNSFSVTALDAVGNSSSAATTAILLDTIPPAVPVIAAVTSPTNVTTQLLTGTMASDSVVIKVNGGTTGVSILSSTTWQASVNLNEGNNSFSVTALDAVGNSSAAATTAILLDTIPPAVPVIAAVTSPTSITTQLLSGTKVTDAASIKVNGSTTGVSIVSSTAWQKTVNLVLGVNNFSVTALDAVGNESTAATTAITLTSPVPVVSSLSSSTGSNLNAATITVTGSGFFGGIGSSTVSAVKLGTISIGSYLAASDNILGFVIPAGTMIGTYDVTVTALGGTSVTSSADVYIVTTPAPVVSSLSVSTGSNVAPVTISVNGLGFFGGIGSSTVSSVKLGTLSIAAGYTATNDSTITGVIIPSGLAAGTYDVTVAALGGTSVTSSGDKFTVTSAVAPVPTVSSLSVSTGSNVAPVTISVNGTGFFGGVGSGTVSSVKLGTLAIAAGYTAANDSTITGVVIPSGLALGTYDITVTALGGTSATVSGDRFTVTTPVPTVSGLSQTSATSAMAATISVNGTGFFGGIGANTVSAVKLGTLSIAAGYTAANDSTITGVVIPSGLALGTYDITVTALGGTSVTSLADKFTVTSVAAPVVSSLSVSNGSNLVPITISVNGTGFFGGAGSSTVSAVKIGTSAIVGYTATNDSTITGVIIPSGLAIGTYDVTVTALGGTSATVAGDRFTVTTPAPVVSGLSQTTASNTLPVTIIVSGSGFFAGLGSSTVSSVKFGTLSLTFSAASSDSAIPGVIIPALVLPGTYDVTVIAAGGTSATVSADKFIVTATVPVVSSLSVTTGSNLAAVTLNITGAGFFGGVSSSTVSSVKLGAITIAAGYTVASDSSITGIIIPAGKPVGAYDITVTTSGGTSVTVAGDLFTVTTPAPVVSSISASTGVNTAPVTISLTGTGFFGGLASSTVSTVKLGYYTLSGYNVASDLSITNVIIPAGTVSGTYDITVTAAGGTSATSSADKYSVPPTPFVSNLTPDNIGYLSSVTISITGSGFFSGTGTSNVTQVRLADASSTVLTGWSVASDTQINGVFIPATLAPGTYNVLVATTLGGINSYSAVKFRVIGPSIAFTTAGSVLTGKTITITGNITIGANPAPAGTGVTITLNIIKPDTTLITSTGFVTTLGYFSFPLALADLNQLGDYRYTISYGGVLASSDFMIAELPKSGDVAIGGKVFTPGSNGAFNKAVFTYTTPPTTGVDIAELTILSLRGRLIKKMTFAAGATIAWDGTDSNGNVCDGGIVIWRLKSGGKVSGGTLVVAK